MATMALRGLIAGWASMPIFTAHVLCRSSVIFTLSNWSKYGGLAKFALLGPVWGDRKHSPRQLSSVISFTRVLVIFQNKLLNKISSNSHHNRKNFNCRLQKSSNFAMENTYDRFGESSRVWYLNKAHYVIFDLRHS